MENVVKFNFHGNELTVIEKDGNQFVAMKPIVEALGLHWSNQLQAIKDDSNLNSTMLLSSTVGADGKSREMVCLPLDKINGWLFTISPNQYSDERREKIKMYREECFNALYNHFHNIPAIPQDTLDQLEMAVKIARAERNRADSLQLINEEMQPKVKMLQDNLQSQELVTINKIAIDLNISAICLNRFLKENKICYKQGKTWFAFEYWRDLGLFKLDKLIQIVNNEPHTREHLKATQKGRLFILELYKTKGLPKATYKRLFETLPAVKANPVEPFQVGLFPKLRDKMKYFKDLAIPEHEQSDSIIDCCNSTNMNCGPCCHCLFSYIKDDLLDAKDNTEIFQQWIKLNRPCEVRDNVTN